MTFVLVINSVDMWRFTLLNHLFLIENFKPIIPKTCSNINYFETPMVIPGTCLAENEKKFVEEILNFEANIWRSYDLCLVNDK